MRALRQSMTRVQRGLQRFETRTEQAGNMVKGGKWLRRLAGTAAGLLIPGAAMLTAFTAQDRPESTCPDCSEVGKGAPQQSVTLVVAGEKPFGLPDGDSDLIAQHVRDLHAGRSPGFSGLPSLNITAAVAPQGVIRVAPQPNSWYRTHLEQGDFFWALPDANFTLVATRVNGCSQEDTCMARIGLLPSNSTQQQPAPFVAVNRGRFVAEAAGTADAQCASATTLTDGVWQCALVDMASTEGLNTSDDDLCVWMKPADVTTEPGFVFDIRWLRTSFGNGSYSGHCAALWPNHDL